MKQENIPTYIKQIQTDDNLADNKMLRDLVEFIKPCSNDMVLDIGCGAFNATRNIYPSVRKVVALDEYPQPREEFVSTLQQLKKEGKVEVKQVDVCKLVDIFKPETFDIVIAYFSLHHFEDISQVIKGVGKVLKKCGKFYISEGTFLNENLRRVFELLRIFRYKNYREYCDPKNILEMLLKEGFAIYDYSTEIPLLEAPCSVETLLAYSEKDVINNSAHDSIRKSISEYLINLPSLWKGRNVEEKGTKIFYDAFQILAVKK